MSEMKFEPGIEYTVGDKVFMIMHRDWLDIWLDRIQQRRWDVPKTERRWFRCTGTKAGAIWPQVHE